MTKSCLLAVVLVCVTPALFAQDFLDRLDQKLTLSAFNDNVRARVSGTLDLEFFAFQQPAPGLIDVSGDTLFNPRLTIFLDAQLGPNFYFFSQTRVDRHFDAFENGAQIRLDEYALRFTPWKDGRFSLQAGKFATVVGRWVERHLSWDNAFISAPLIYEHALPLEDMSAPDIPFDGQLHDEKYEYLPVIWGPSYASGASVAGRAGKFEYAAEIKNAALASRPESWDATRNDFSNPTVSTRLGFRPNEAWNFGLSASNGAYLSPEAQDTLPPGQDIGDFHETDIAQDISFAWHHLQLWAEFHETRFQVPRLGDADTFGYFLEAKYKFTPQLFGAVRWNQQFFDQVSNGAGDRVSWAPDTSRLEMALTFRFTAYTQLKVEYYLQHEDGGRRDFENVFATQLTVRF